MSSKLQIIFHIANAFEALLVHSLPRHYVSINIKQDLINICRVISFGVYVFMMRLPKFETHNEWVMQKQEPIGVW